MPEPSDAALEVRALVGDGPWHRFAPRSLSPILTAALAAFVEGGFHGASVRDIAQRVGVTVPTLYYHHGSKQGLLLALLERSMTELTLRTEMALSEAGDDPLTRLVDVVDCTVRFMCHRTDTAVLDAQARFLDDDAHAVYERPRDAFERRVRTVVEAGVDAGVFTTDHPKDTTRILLGSYQSIATWYRADGDLGPEEVAARHVAFTLDALRVDRRRRDAATRRARQR